MGDKIIGILDDYLLNQDIATILKTYIFEDFETFLDDEEAIHQYMLHPNPEFIQFQNWMDREAIPNRNFHNRMVGMVCQSIQFSNWTNACLRSNIHIKIYIMPVW
jgi:hypothetical protein